MSDVAGGPDRPRPEPSTAELVQEAGEQISRLVRAELALARAELLGKARHAGLGVGLVGAAGIVALYGLGALTAAAILLLALALPAWIAALVVGVVLFTMAAALAVVGRQQARHASPPVPEAAVRGVRADIDTVANALRERRRR
jgi:hypothetical protein